MIQDDDDDDVGRSLMMLQGVMFVELSVPFCS